ncbi:hypothetical protein NEAUS03_1767 [Nematocida ausubeli]|nr:hypothetical protein NEAUS03_1767 [Nematocida ausubeli]
MKEDTERRDLLICGVNGFTAQKLLEYILCNRPELSVGVTCRSEEKLTRTFRDITVKKESSKALAKVATHITGVDNIGKLSRIFEGYKVIINCIGPFAITGLSIVEAAIRARSHYIDCTGEPGFIEESMKMFGEKAQSEEIIIAHACGFDSLPLDIGIMYTMQQIQEKGGRAESIESYMHLINSKINLGTFKTVITSLDNLKKREKRGESSQKASKKSSDKDKKDGRRGPKVKKMPFFSPLVNMYAVIFPGSDSYVLRKTNALLGGIYPVCHCYMAVSSLIGMAYLLFLCLLVGIVYILPSSLRAVAYDYIDVLSFGAVRTEGPSEQEILCSGFKTHIFARGVDENDNPTTYKTLVSGPDPGYISTPIALLVSAEIILSNQAGVQNKKGVLTPGALFVDTDIIPRLTKEKIVFCIAADDKH